MVRLSAQERYMRRRNYRTRSSMKFLVSLSESLFLTGLLIGWSWTRRDAKTNLGTTQRRNQRQLKSQSIQSVNRLSRYRLSVLKAALASNSSLVGPQFPSFP